MAPAPAGSCAGSVGCLQEHARRSAGRPDRSRRCERVRIGYPQQRYAEQDERHDVRRSTAKTVAMLLAAVVTACGGESNSASCQQAAQAELCLVTGEDRARGRSSSQPRLDARGFQPGTVLTITPEGGAPTTVPIDSEGLDSGGVFAFMGPSGSQPLRWRIEGRDSAGNEVAFTVVCSTLSECEPDAG